MYFYLKSKEAAGNVLKQVKEFPMNISNFQTMMLLQLGWLDDHHIILSLIGYRIHETQQNQKCRITRRISAEDTVSALSVVHSVAIHVRSIIYENLFNFTHYAQATNFSFALPRSCYVSNSILKVPLVASPQQKSRQNKVNNGP